MANINYINTGSSANKGDGDTLRTAFNKINANFRYIGTFTGASFEGVAESIIPAGNGIYDLGAPSNNWRHLFLENTVYFNNLPLSVDANNRLIFNNDVLSTGTVDLLNVSTNILPSNDTLSLGSQSSQWKTIFLNPNGLVIGGNIVNATAETLTVNGNIIKGEKGDTGPKGDTGTVAAITIASTTETGIVKIGSNIDIDLDGTIGIKPATSDYPGVVRIGEGLTVDGLGTISVQVPPSNIFTSSLISVGGPYSIGTETNRWSKLYLTQDSLYIGNVKLTSFGGKLYAREYILNEAGEEVYLGDAFLGTANLLPQTKEGILYNNGAGDLSWLSEPFTPNTGGFIFTSTVDSNVISLSNDKTSSTGITIISPYGPEWNGISQVILEVGNSKRWTFSDRLIFPDGTSQFSAITPVDLNLVTTNILPSQDVQYDLGSIQKAWRSLYVGTGTIYINGVSIGVDDNNRITANGSPIVTINTSGNLTVSGSTLTEITISAVTGNITFNGTDIIGTATDLVSQGLISLVPNNGLINPENPLEGDYKTYGRYLNIYPSTSSNQIHISAGVGGSGEADLIIGDDNKYVKVGSNGNVSIRAHNRFSSANAAWSFDSTGALTFPDGTVQTTAASSGTANTGNVKFVDNTIYTETGSLAIYTSGGTTGNNRVDIEADQFNVDVTNRIALYSGGELVIATNNTSSSRSWTLQQDGSIAFPDASVQSTAWTGSYSPSNATDWAEPAPTTIAGAIDRLAAAIKILSGGSGA